MASIIIFYFLFIQFSEIIQAEHSPCGDWTPFRDEKCFKVLPGKMASFQDAFKSCRELDSASTLPTIKNQAEQDFLVDLLFTKGKLPNNAWLGAAYLKDKYVWLADNSTIDPKGFNNWEAAPRAEKSHCVEMEAEATRRGKWIDEPCDKINQVVCQKPPIWSIAFIQATLLETRKELERTKQDLEQSKANSKAELERTKQSLLPLGFIYVQLPKEAAPSVLWPSMTWTEISSSYAGVFFRVTGGASAAFGSIQSEECPRIDSARYLIFGSGEGARFEKATFTRGSSATLLTGRFAAGNIENAVELHTSEGEVRPRNMAIKVWKRSA